MYSSFVQITTDIIWNKGRVRLKMKHKSQIGPLLQSYRQGKQLALPHSFPIPIKKKHIWSIGTTPATPCDTLTWKQRDDALGSSSRQQKHTWGPHQVLTPDETTEAVNQSYVELMGGQEDPAGRPRHHITKSCSHRSILLSLSQPSTLCRLYCPAPAVRRSGSASARPRAGRCWSLDAIDSRHA